MGINWKLKSTVLMAVITGYPGYAQVEHQAPVIDGQPAAIGGNACSSENTQTSISLDESGRSYLVIDHYDLASTIHSAQLASRSSCVLRFHVNIPAGKQLVLENTYSYGWFDLISSITSSAAFTVILFSELVQRGMATINSNHYRYGDFYLLAKNSHTSKCSEETQSGLLGVNLATAAQARSTSAEGLLNLMQTTLVYKLEDCVAAER